MSIQLWCPSPPSTRSVYCPSMSLIAWCRRATFHRGLFVTVLATALMMPAVGVPTGFVSADPAGAVVGAPRENMSAIAAGSGHTCVIVTAGEVVCWGDDTFGQLGNGATTGLVDAPGSPIVLPLGTHAIALTAGDDHTCALLSNGQVSCWGDDSFGQLGNGAATGNVDAPPASIILPGGVTVFATAIAAGGRHTCALLSSAQVSCWGDDTAGQLGNGAATGVVDSPSPPIDFSGGAPITVSASAIAAGEAHTCAIVAGGQLTCWGSDASGQLGNGAPVGNIAAPPAAVKLPGLATAMAVSLGQDHSCALLSTGRISCWGSDGSGQLGNGSATGNVASPPGTVALPGGLTATAVVAGRAHTCALVRTGSPTCWGDDNAGQLGNGAPGPQVAPPSLLAFPDGVAALALTTGDDHVCALLSTHKLTCWGSDATGQLGNGSPTSNVTVPASVVSTGIGTANAIATGGSNSCAMLSAGAVSCWGDNGFGKLGQGVAFGGNLHSPPEPVALPGGATAVALAAGQQHNCALLANGEVTCWGVGFNGTLGTGNTANLASPPPPVILPGGLTAAAVTAGYQHTCALLVDGEVTCWGQDDRGQVGNGPSTGVVLSPSATLALPGASKATAIDAGTSHTCALLTTGGVTCWGNDDYGQLGNGSGTGNVDSPPAPVALPGGETATAIAAGFYTTCALLTSGAISCWGRDYYGLLGNGAPTQDMVSPPTPILLPGGATATAIATRNRHMCALLSTGALSCWGSDEYGQLGNGATTGDKDSPAPPLSLPGGETAVAIATGYYHTCAILASSLVTCWGEDRSGELGNGAITGNVVSPPTPIALPTEPLIVEPQPAGFVPWIVVPPSDTPGAAGPAGVPVEDPVNTASGNLVDTHTDLGGEAFGLDLVRSYNTFDPITSVLGDRWRVGIGGMLAEENGNVRYTLADGSPFVFTPDADNGWVTPTGLTAVLSTDPASPSGGGGLPMLRMTYPDGMIERFDTTGRLIEQVAWDGRTATSSFDGVGRLDTVTASTGQVLSFTYDGTGRLVSAQLSTGRQVLYGYDTNARLSSVTGEFGDVTSMTYTMNGWLKSRTGPDGVVEMLNTFDTDGRVATQTSASGGVTSFTYDAAEGATYVHDSVTDTSVRYQHDPTGRVVAITDAFGNAAERAYDVASNLVAGVDRNGQLATATYDANNNLTSITEPGVGVTSYVYDGLDRIVSVTDPTNATTTYGYQLVERIPSTVTNTLNQTTTFDVVDGLTMSATDADGVTITYGYDLQRRLTSVTNEYNQSTTYAYNTRGQRTTTTSPSGRTTTSTYDPVTHRLSSITAADGGVTAYSHDAAGRVLTVTDPTGAVTTNTYDSAGRLETSTDPGGSVTSYVYDGNDHLVKTIEPGGAENSTMYGPLGRVTSTKDPLNRVSSYEYDAEGRQTRSTDSAGGVRQTLFDSSGRPFKTIDPNNRETVTGYDAFGRVSTVTAPGSLVTTYGYDALGRTQTVTDPRSGATTTTYTPGGRTNTITDPVGLITSYGYDLAGRQASITAPGNLTTAFAYNADSETTSVTSPGGLVTAATFDPAGRIATSTDPAGVVTTNTWSLRGELLTTRTGLEGTTRYVYNPNRTLASTTDALGRVTTFGYDARHNQTSRTAPNGAVETWTYNAANELLTAVDPLARTTAYTYDTAGRVATITDPSGRVQTNTYNLDGTINTEAYAGGTTTSYNYDNAGRVASLTDTSGTFAFGYEPAGQLASMSTPSGRQTNWSYDAAGRRTQLTHPNGASYQYAYDTSGRPRTITPGEILADTFTATTGTPPDTNRWTTTVAAGGTATIQANALRLLFTSTSSSTASVTSKAAAAQDSEQLVRYQFASTGTSTAGTFSVQARNSASGNIRVEFSSNTTTATIFRTIGTTSTSLGTFTVPVGTTPRWVRLRVVGTTVNVRNWADGTTEPATWTATVTNATGVTTSGVLKLDVTRSKGTNSVTIDNYRHTDPTNPLTPVVTYGYNTNSQVTTETLIGGLRTRSYTLGRLTNFTETLPGLSVSTGRTYDTTGRIATETTGAITTTYGYDNASQLTNATPSSGTASGWTYDQNGNRATETIGATTTRYQRDIAGQLCWTTTATMPPTPTCAAPPTGATTYTHDNAGRLLTETVTATNKATYTYDPAGRQSTAQRINGATTTTQTRNYNMLNQLTGTTNTGSSTTTGFYDWDPTSPAAQLLAITTGNTTTDLVAGAAGWAAARTATNTAIGQDIYGSAVPTTGTTTLARSATYTAYGTPTGSNIFEPRLGYRGELTLDNHIYLRARNYQPTLGQFTTIDPVNGLPGTTTLNNNYTYANNNPLHLIDPLGLYGINDNNLARDLTRPRPPDGSWSLAGEVDLLVKPALALGGRAALVAAGTPTVVVGGIVVASGILVYQGFQLHEAFGDLGRVRAQEREAKENLQYTLDVVQEAVNNGDIPPGTYGGQNFEPEPGSPAALHRSSATNTADRVVIGKMADITADGALGAGERTLLDQLPRLATAEAQWAQNERVLLQEMKSGVPIRDATIDGMGNLANNTGYLYWERATLIREGWTYDAGTHLWSPGG